MKKKLFIILTRDQRNRQRALPGCYPAQEGPRLCHLLQQLDQASCSRHSSLCPPSLLQHQNLQGHSGEWLLAQLVSNKFIPVACAIKHFTALLIVSS